MHENEKFDESRMFHGPGTLKVYVPTNPPPQRDDYKLDFPPGNPPEVHCHGRVANYWIVLREGKMPYLNDFAELNEDKKEWLRSIEPDVKKMLSE